MGRRKIIKESVPGCCGFVLGTVGVFHLSCLCLVSCFISGDAVSRGLQGEERRSGSSTCVYYMDIME